jgi:DNA-binding MarR family transcriptional regulator
MRGSEIRVLQALEEEQSLSELAEELDLSENYTSELVSDLEEKDLVYTRKDGKTKLAKASGNRVVELLQALKHDYPHIEFADLLTPKAFGVLYYLNERRTVSEISELTGDYRNTVNRILSKLTDRGICGKDGAHYQLNDQFQQLHQLAESYATHQHKLETPVSSFSILWETYDRFLVETEEAIESESFESTGPARFQEFGIPLLNTSKKHYLYTDQDYQLTVPELVSHTLLVDSGTRHQTYCLLLLEKHDPDKERVLESADTYDLQETVETLYRYLETKGKTRTESLPPWTEFESTADDYGVQV